MLPYLKRGSFSDVIKFHFIIFLVQLDVEEMQIKDIFIEKFTFDLYYMTILQEYKSLFNRTSSGSEV